MHRLPKALDSVLPVFLVVAGLGVAAIGVLGVPSVSATPEPPPGPEIAYAQTWTFPDLIRHADSGEVLVITAPSTADRSARNGTAAATDGPKLGARTIDGLWAKV